MTPLILTGTISVTIALILFSIVSIKALRSKQLTICLVVGYSIGTILDLTSLLCMSIAASHPPFTIHGIIGYSALLTMLIGVIRVIIQYRTGDHSLPENLGTYLKYVYIYWVIAYFTGAFMATMG